jgi:hypothetical protein
MKLGKIKEVEILQRNLTDKEVEKCLPGAINTE